MKFLEERLVALDVVATTPEETIRKAGELLVQQGAVEESYIDAMLLSYEENGPYFVLAPQIALPHARPEDGVKEASVSLVRLKKPLNFGSERNDPVKFVFALGASSSEEHLEILQKLTVLLNDQHNLEKLESAEDYQQIKALFN
ncbi:PTS sugar transporter subunit IIA [Sutcliffiella rhizosphaerae]|uniref:Ascorbate-specific PTS system EIIA component n=1 Tax=Sutcliffiella rhizosphaerae TaxID=2880967 RepID=A0ABM8YMH0_9BACI|nr:PTS sugar transporter subunit IIA [Sutcliffiella rhizosphaerae]CAG9621164.1 Ascorbate-specific PTS system EIIA component [Sutcliffiella rhizosphaerae]